ncbi:MULTISPECIES: YkuJ family protein [Bacillaceae]|uniref:YkuJ family protein n=1 Tax=Bacillaceae TaxID=186817 RepID=UPI001BDF392F|nr:MULTISPECIES: YkuJ family protein [Bacillaceae]MDX8359905.1 YkuJ family protein [Cytobacillus sp. IB215316]
MSQLQAIINRLNSLRENTLQGDLSQRFFEVEGEKKCSVKFFQNNNAFELEVYEKGEQSKRYQFDNIDMIAIEIFDLIQ